MPVNPQPNQARHVGATVDTHAITIYPRNYCHAAFQLTPTPSDCFAHQNRFSLLDDNDNEDNLYLPNHAQPTPTNSTTTTQYTLADTGTSGHFILEHAQHVINRQCNTNSISVMLLDGAILWSTHTCNLHITGLSSLATHAHIVPSLAHSSLISISTLCNDGCTATFTDKFCSIWYNNCLVLQGNRDPGTNLWQLTITPTNTPTPTSTTAPRHLANSIHTITHILNRVKYMHQAFFCPPIQTLLRAAHLGFLDTCPFLDLDTITKHLSKSPATAKGGM